MPAFSTFTIFHAAGSFCTVTSLGHNCVFET